MNNSLIFGKNTLERVVSCEPSDSSNELFIENEDGTITSRIVPNKYWVLAHTPIDKEFKPLEGDLFFKYIKLYDLKDDFLLDRKRYYKYDIYSIFDDKEASMVIYGYTYYKGMKMQDVSILSFDIESTGLEHNDNSKVLLISNTFRKNGVITRKLFAYDEYEKESDLFDAWCNWVREVNPSILLGHNVYSYDLPYLNFCAKKAGTEIKLGRDGSAIRILDYESKFRVDGSKELHYHKVRCYGREIIDTMFLAYQHDIGREYESYALKKIISHEKLEKSDRTFYDASQIRFKYKDKEEWEKIKEYCKDDSDDSLNLYDKIGSASFYSSQYVPKSFQLIIESASGSKINSILIRSYLQDWHSIPKASETASHVQGGISFGVPAIYSNVIKIDIKSAYPSQVLRFKLFDKFKDPRGNFYLLTKYFTEKRFELKELARNDETGYYKAQDATAKVFINSTYGLCNAPGLNFNSQVIASKITLETRKIIDNALIWASGYDSNYWMKKNDTA